MPPAVQREGTHHAWKHAHLTDRGVRRLRRSGPLRHRPGRHPGRGGHSRPHRDHPGSDLAGRPGATSGLVHKSVRRVRRGRQRRHRSGSPPAGGHDAAVTRSPTRSRRDGTSYIEYAYTFDGVTHHLRGSGSQRHRKAMALFQTLSPARTTFGGRQPGRAARGAHRCAAPIAGRIADVSTKDGVLTADYANTLGQAYAAHALTKAGSSEAADAVAFLLKQQCPNGGFRLAFTASKTAAGQSCTDNTTAETDATAIALQQLSLIPTTVTDHRREDRGADLAASTQQKADGSWGGGPSTEASNANSTGLAARRWATRPRSGRRRSGCEPARRRLRRLRQARGAVRRDRLRRRRAHHRPQRRHHRRCDQGPVAPSHRAGAPGHGVPPRGHHPGRSRPRPGPAATCKAGPPAALTTRASSPATSSA